MSRVNVQSTLTPAEDNEGERFLSSIEPVSVCRLQQCGFAQVMPITDGENLGGLGLIVNWAVVARLDELMMVGIETVE